jgi:hypothetical protein
MIIAAMMMHQRRRRRRRRRRRLLRLAGRWCHCPRIKRPNDPMKNGDDDNDDDCDCDDDDDDSESNVEDPPRASGHRHRFPTSRYRLYTRSMGDRQHGRRRFLACTLNPKILTLEPISQHHKKCIALTTNGVFDVLTHQQVMNFLCFAHYHDDDDDDNIIDNNNNNNNRNSDDAATTTESLSTSGANTCLSSKQFYRPVTRNGCAMKIAMMTTTTKM